MACSLIMCLDHRLSHIHMMGKISVFDCFHFCFSFLLGFFFLFEMVLHRKSSVCLSVRPFFFCFSFTFFFYRVSVIISPYLWALGVFFVLLILSTIVRPNLLYATNSHHISHTRYLSLSFSLRRQARNPSFLCISV